MDSSSIKTAFSISRNIGEYTNAEDIGKDIDALTHENFVLSQTAEVLERYLRKRSPAMLIGMDRFVEMAPPTLRRLSSVKTDRSSSIVSAKSYPSPALTVTRASTTSSLMHGFTSRSNAQSFGSYRINPMVRVDMVERELEEGRMTMEKLQRRFESAKFLLQTEEENLRIDIDLLDELKTKLDNFLTNNANSETGKVCHDKFFRLVEHELETGDRLLRKMKLKTKSLHNEYKRMSAQQQQKLELRERLHPVDIDKLLIENGELLEILELKNKDLQDLKKTVGKKGQNLVSVKSKLNNTDISLETLKQDSERKETKCKFIEEKQVQNENLLKAAENNNLYFKNLNTTYKSVDVHSYLLTQSTLEGLKSEKDVWERRIKYQNQQISLLEHQIKQLSPIGPARPRFQSFRRFGYSISNSKLFNSISAFTINKK